MGRLCGRDDGRENKIDENNFRHMINGHKFQTSGILEKKYSNIDASRREGA